MNLNSHWRLLEQTSTTSSITKTTEQSRPIKYNYFDYQDNNKEEVPILKEKTEDDIRSVSSYYKEEFRPNTTPRVPQPAERESR